MSYILSEISTLLLLFDYEDTMKTENQNVESYIIMCKIKHANSIIMGSMHSKSVGMFERVSGF